MTQMSLFLNSDLLQIFFILVGTTLAYPTDSDPFLSIKITRPGSTIDSTVSKTQVNVRQVGNIVLTFTTKSGFLNGFIIPKTSPDGEQNLNEPFHPHVPPFLALRPVNGERPLVLPSAAAR